MCDRSRNTSVGLFCSFSKRFSLFSRTLKFYFLLNSCKAAIENARVKLEDAIEIDTVDEVPQTPRTAEPRTAEPKTPHGPKFDEGLFAPTNLSK